MPPPRVLCSNRQCHIEVHWANVRARVQPLRNGCMGTSGKSSQANATVTQRVLATLRLIRKVIHTTAMVVNSAWQIKHT